MKTALLLLATATPASAFSPSRNIDVSSSIRNLGGSSRRSSTTKIQAHQKLEAILFDCDGVLADTERDGHRLAFNIAFKDNGIDESWDEARYGKLLEVGGGKERMTAHWVSVIFMCKRRCYTSCTCVYSRCHNSTAYIPLTISIINNKSNADAKHRTK